jgi:hypothetical protein
VTKQALDHAIAYVCMKPDLPAGDARRQLRSFLEVRIIRVILDRVALIARTTPRALATTTAYNTTQARTDAQ